MGSVQLLPQHAPRFLWNGSDRRTTSCLFLLVSRSCLFSRHFEFFLLFFKVIWAAPEIIDFQRCGSLSLVVLLFRLFVRITGFCFTVLAVQFLFLLSFYFCDCRWVWLLYEAYRIKTSSIQKKKKKFKIICFLLSSWYI